MGPVSATLPHVFRYVMTSDWLENSRVRDGDHVVSTDYRPRLLRKESRLQRTGQLRLAAVASASFGAVGLGLIIGAVWRAGSTTRQTNIAFSLSIIVAFSLAIAFSLIYMLQSQSRIAKNQEMAREIASERESLRDRAEELRASRLRFQSYASMLGSGEAIVRVSAAQSLARLADEALLSEDTSLTHDCVSLLCTYLRIPAKVDSDTDWQVREEIVKLIAGHLRDSEAATTWSTFPLDFNGAEFRGGSFASCTFGDLVDFGNTRFSGHFTFDHADFHGVARFSGAHFSGSGINFNRVTFRNYADFEGAFFGGIIIKFFEAKFEDIADFDKVTFASHLVSFSKAFFSHVSFERSIFESGCDVDFSRSTVTGSISFAHADFAGGYLFLRDTQFHEGVRIDFRNPQRWLVEPDVPWGDELPKEDRKLTVLPLDWPPTPTGSRILLPSTFGERLALRVPLGIRNLDDLSLFLGDLDSLYRLCAGEVYSDEVALPLAVSYIATGSLLVELYEQYQPWIVGAGSGGLLGVIGRTLVSGKVEQLATIVPRMKSAYLRAQADVHDARNGKTRKEIEGIQLNIELERVRAEAAEATRLQQQLAPTVTRIRRTAPNLQIVPPRNAPDDSTDG